MGLRQSLRLVRSAHLSHQTVDRRLQPQATPRRYRRPHTLGACEQPAWKRHLALADAFLAAPEFALKYGANPSNLQYVTELYTNVLGRAPDQAGLNYWVGQADAGQPRDQLLIDFAISQENVNLIGSHITHGYWTTH